MIGYGFAHAELIRNLIQGEAPSSRVRSQAAGLAALTTTRFSNAR